MLISRPAASADLPVVAALSDHCCVYSAAQPCGLNLLHHHPRGSELLAVAYGGPEGVITGFVEENGKLQ